MLRDKDFAYDIRDYLRDDKGRIKNVIKGSLSSTEGRLTKEVRDKLDLWLKVLSSETPLLFCEFHDDDTNPQVGLSRILEHALVNSSATDDIDIDERICQKHIDMLESERLSVITMKEQLRQARDINVLRFRDHHCGLEGCGIETALERIRTAYMSKVEVKLIDRKLELWKYEFDV
ncbi:hypothetical protein BGZ65_009353 [Modicella reniformis]|uniref:Uncharacterized protein n=1 Tax=Modicella reniformis TaxID=1440133 RepID=A0A9P6MEE1_9FUNG|nr:hypothetical protein BGZ65_009353 [Modicella reniformis]